MTKPTLYGIKNCDTMKKAFKWLEAHNIDYHFHDYKKEGVDEKILKQAINEHGWESVINKRGTTWRKLPQDIKDNMNDESAIYTAKDNASIIKRPLLVHEGSTYLGFKDELYTSIFK